MSRGSLYRDCYYYCKYTLKIHSDIKLCFFFKDPIFFPLRLQKHERWQIGVTERLGVMAHAFNPSTSGGRGEPSLHSEFQATSQDYIVGPCLKQTKSKQTNKKQNQEGVVAESYCHSYMLK